LMLAIMFATMFSANAQIATENAKLFDNTYVTVNAGATTPLAFDAVFPVNTTAGIAVGKWFTPVWGAEVEGTAWFGSHTFGGSQARFDGLSHNFVRGSYVGVNGLVNLSNLFCGYKGTPRTFEISTMLGTGWWHVYRPSSQGDDFNGLGVKTGLDLAFNLGKTKAHTLSIRPAVLWNVNSPSGMAPGDADMYLSFDKRGAQLYLGVAYTFHFKTSNGTRHFKNYDVGAMLSEIDRLNTELAKKPTEVIVEKTVIKEVDTDTKAVQHATGFGVKETVFFAFDSAELDDNAKATLDQLGENGTYEVLGYASNEGSLKYNKALSQRRADAVKAYLESRGAKVVKAEGLGVVFGPTTGRVAIVTLK